MKLTILGSGICIFDKERKGPSFLLEVNKQLLLFDCGWGFGENLIKAGHQPFDLDHIFISHPHADHMGSLINILQSIFVATKFFPEKSRTKPLFLHAYEGFKRDYEKLRSILFPERDEAYEINIVEHRNDRKIYDSFELSTIEVNHRPDLFHSTAYRIDAEETSFVYSGDCGYDERLIALADSAHLLILDCSTTSKIYRKHKARKNHLSPFECGEVAKQAKIEKLVLYHIYYDLTNKEEIEEEIRKNYKGELIFSEDLQKITV